jgi:ABC-type transporter Mla maintaining outer membrane lipid asymmetry permease subunit MlaE
MMLIKIIITLITKLQAILLLSVNSINYVVFSKLVACLVGWNLL